jgi:hypothetical protein
VFEAGAKDRLVETNSEKTVGSYPSSMGHGKSMDPILIATMNFWVLLSRKVD